jgi:hypothetical protein
MTPEQKKDIVKQFVQFCKEELGIEQLPTISFTDDRDWAVGRHSFGEYNPYKRHLDVYEGNRNMADILRTLAHELTHHRQHELGHIKGVHDGKAGSPIENQANAAAGVLMRNFGRSHEIIYEVCLPTLREIYEVEKSRNIQIYCDMDGVLCDFEKRFEYYYDVPAQQYYKEKGKTAFNDAVDEAGVQFWSKMDWMPGGRELWSIIGKFNPIILTSPSKFKYAKEGKLQWIKNNLNPQPKDIMFAQTGDKHSILKGKTPQEIKSSILIDDHYPNLAPWKELGGVGIFHKSIDKTKDILSKFRIQ